MPTIRRYFPGSLLSLATAAYVFLGWALGVYLLCQPSWYLEVLGVGLVAHSLMISAYLVHECAHGSVYHSVWANNLLGSALCWLNGACYAGFESLKQKHIRHHADRLDVVTFDYRATLRRAPSWLRRFVLTLEWAYIPAVEILMRGLVITLPFRHAARRRERPRVLARLGLRLLALAGLTYVSPQAMLLYVLAYLLCLQGLRFMDAYQHTYEVYPLLDGLRPPPDQLRDAHYEYEHTYSNLLSVRWPWLNLLVLNFCYHNAHHARPDVPWYRLPRLHSELYGADQSQLLPASLLWRSYHRDRVRRVMAEDYGEVRRTPAQVEGFIGAVGVSFLTAV